MYIRRDNLHINTMVTFDRGWGFVENFSPIMYVRKKQSALTCYRHDKLRKNFVVIFYLWKKLLKHTRVFRYKYHDNIRTVESVTHVQCPMVTLTGGG